MNSRAQKTATTLPCFLGCTPALSALLLLLACTAANPQSSQQPDWGKLPFNELLQAAERGSAEAMGYVYYAYLRGRGVPRDYVRAKEWLVKAAEAGDAYAQCVLGKTFEEPSWEGTGQDRHLPPPNMPEAVRWYRRSADQGWPAGQYGLGLCYVNGTGVELDEERGVDLVRTAADAHYAMAMVGLAELYARGIGQPRNERDRPIRILQHVVEAGFTEGAQAVHDAYQQLVFRHEYGIGTPRDLLAAVELYCRAVLSDVEDFSFENKMDFKVVPRAVLGRYTASSEHRQLDILWPHSGEGSDRFLATLALYLKAATHQDPWGLTEIGRMYLSGRETPKNPVKAWMWFTLAAEKGAKPVDLAKAEELLTSQELAQARNNLPELRAALARIGAAARPASQGRS